MASTESSNWWSEGPLYLSPTETPITPPLSDDLDYFQPPWATAADSRSEVAETKTTEPFAAALDPWVSGTYEQPCWSSNLFDTVLPEDLVANETELQQPLQATRGLSVSPLSRRRCSSISMIPLSNVDLGKTIKQEMSPSSSATVRSTPGVARMVSPNATKRRLSMASTDRAATPSRHRSSASNNDRRKGRASHNEIERKYRNRLNGQFELLMNTLGVDRFDDALGAEACSRQHSKAEVLALASRRIRELEREVQSRHDEVQRLKNDLDRARFSTQLPLVPLSTGWSLPV